MLPSMFSDDYVLYSQLLAQGGEDVAKVIQVYAELLMDPKISLTMKVIVSVEGTVEYDG